MRRQRGYTFNDMIVTVAIVSVLVLVVGFLVLNINMPHRRGPAYRTICSTNLSGCYKAFYTYSITNRDIFPIAGKATPGGSAIGFAEGDRHAGSGAALDDNVTASLWLTVRDGSTGTKSWVCPERRGAEPDPLLELNATGDVYEIGRAAMLSNCYDFGLSSTLSYSPINMYHKTTGKMAWSANVPPDWIIMGDSNDNDSGLSRHTLAKGAPQTDVESVENSTNHTREGQNVLFGDGHVEFVNDPFAGPADDNVYAMTIAGRNEPPKLGHNDGDAATDPAVAKQDVVLLPITGNGGGAGSLDPKD